MHNRTAVFAVSLAACGFVCLSGCAVSNAPQDRQSTSATLPNELHWFRDSAEQRATYIEVYRSATRAARSRSAGLAPHSWAVILDVDETILDNSEYARRLAISGAKHSDARWNAWVREKSAPRLPGAKEFIDTVIDQLHGEVVLVTNRTQAQCRYTQENLRAQQIRYQRILCDSSGDGNKNPRFQSVGDGRSGKPLTVLIWIGDNIQDFPSLDQRHPGDFSRFGVSYFVLPNPLYGSWQSLPPG